MCTAMMDIFMRVNSEETQKNWSTAAIRGRRGGRDTSANLALPAVGNGVGVLIRPSLTASAALRRCGSAWSLYDMPRPEIGKDKKKYHD